jgi:hypothetical protein
MVREAQLIICAAPCDCNLYADGPQTVAEVLKLGQQLCPKLRECSSPAHHSTIQCCVQMGTKIAQYVLRGGTINNEMADFRREFSFPSGGMIWSSDRKVFEIITDREVAYTKVREFAEMLVSSVKGATSATIPTKENVGNSFEDIVAHATDPDGAIDLRKIEALEGRFSHLPGHSRRCDVLSGPCACGAFH